MSTDEKISQLALIAGADIATDDEMVLVDVSDLTFAATGTNKRTTIADLTTTVGGGGGRGGTFPLTGTDGTIDYSVDLDTSSRVTMSATDIATPTLNAITQAEVDDPTQAFAVLQALQASDRFGYVQTFTSVGGSPESAASMEAAAGGESGLIEIEAEAGGTARSRTTADEILFVRATSAPPDGDLVDSSFALWLDDTIGTTVFNIKAKDSAGTVVTAQIALS